MLIVFLFFLWSQKTRFHFTSTCFDELMKRNRILIYTTTQQRNFYSFWSFVINILKIKRHCYGGKVGRVIYWLGLAARAVQETYSIIGEIRLYITKTMSIFAAYSIDFKRRHGQVTIDSTCPYGSTDMVKSSIILNRNEPHCRYHRYLTRV